MFGANGSGKSTAAYLMNGLIPHFFMGELQGTVTVAGLDTRTADVGQLFGRVGLVLQNTDAQLFCSTVEDEIAFGLESLGLPAATIEKRIRETAAALGIERLLGRAPETLSVGERRLAAMASVLGADPPILVLDEPFSNLDWKYAHRVRTLLAGMHRAGKTLVVIEQTIGPFLRDATRLVVMEAGRCAFSGAVAEGVQAPEFARLVPAYPPRPPTRTAAGGAPLLSVHHLDFRLRRGGNPQGCFLHPAAGRDSGHCRRERGREVDSGETSQRPVAADRRRHQTARQKHPQPSGR